MDANFSLFTLVQKTTGERITLESVDRMLTLSSIIEDEVLSLRLNAELYVGFQDTYHLLPVYERYQKLADVVEKIHVFGVQDNLANFPSKVNLITLKETDRLRHEWFILVNHPQYAVTLVGREFLLHTLNRLERRFSLMMTSQRDKISAFEAALRQAMFQDDDSSAE